MNDAQRLRHDPAMRWIVGGKAASDAAASPSQMGRFETRWLTAEKNFSALANLSGHWIDSVHGRRPPRGVVLDIDSSVSPTHGEQENSVWNGHYACTCYHPLFLFNQFGDLERCSLRPGNVHSADGWQRTICADDFRNERTQSPTIGRSRRFNGLLFDGAGRRVLLPGKSADRRRLGDFQRKSDRRMHRSRYWQKGDPDSPVGFCMATSFDPE